MPTFDLGSLVMDQKIDLGCVAIKIAEKAKFRERVSREKMNDFLGDVFHNSFDYTRFP